MFQDEIELLVAQTFKDAEKDAEIYSRGESGFLFDDTIDEGPAPSDAPLKKPNDSPGILYYLQRNASTFVIRILPTVNLREEWQNVLDAPEDYPSLRLLGSEDERAIEDKLDFYECDNLQLAKALKAQLANKRFPLHEERIINVSDPGDNWWIKNDESGLSVYFKLCRTESINSLVKAGPLGDCDGALSFFNKLYGYFSLLFPVRDFSSAHGQFFMSCEDNSHPLFQELGKVFTEGEIGNGLWERLRELEGQAQKPEVLSSLRRANYFLMEIASMRSFWMVIQNQLDLEAPQGR